MNIAGIVAEYNPFHKGHAYHIAQTRKNTGCEFVICVMSGAFTQRGEPAIFDQWVRTRMALEGGADMVLELPVLFSLSSAESFAFGSVLILAAAGCNTLSFGAEAPNFEVLSRIASILTDEPEIYQKSLAAELSRGVSFPSARTAALRATLPTLDPNILTAPNNILAIEYLKALKKMGSPMQPYILQRKGNYLSTEMQCDYPSAMAIRQAYKEGSFVATTPCVFPEAMFSPVVYKLRTMSLKEIALLPDVSEGLEYRIKNAANTALNWEDLIEKIKSKRYTRTRIQRILAYALLHISKKDMAHSAQIPYIKILGIKKESLCLMRMLREAPIPFVTNPKDFKDTLHCKTNAIATDIYGILADPPMSANRHFTERLIVL